MRFWDGRNAKAATGVLLGLVLLMPPYRAANWISGRGGP
jgi:hypothetical protein